MHWLKSILHEILGLFVDDGSFAFAIVIWLTLAVDALPRMAPAASWTGPAFAAGLALILIQSVLRFSRQNRK